MRSAALALVVSFSSLASAQDPADANQLSAYFVGGAGGDARFDGPGLGVDVDLDAALGIGARAGFSVADFLVIGGLLEWRAFGRDGVDDRDHVFDFDGFAKGRHILEIKQDIALEIYGLIPFGFSAGSFDELDGPWVGFNLGFLAGAMLMLKNKVGAFFESGVRHHHLYQPDDEIDVASTQFAFTLGGALLL